MSRSRAGTVLVLALLVALTFLLALFLPLTYAADQLAADEPLDFELADLEPTTLEIAIHSSPIAVRDNNEATVSPRVFVVHAVVTNTGTVAASELVISLDYHENPTAGWVLVDGEEPQRTPDSLDPGEAYHAYWFASYPYPAGADLSHQYEVSASAANAALVSTTENVFDPQTDRTVLTASYIDTGNNGQVSLSTEITVGVAFTMAVGYDLGTGAQGAILSPVGNLDFDASRLRLQAVSVRFYNTAGTLDTTVDNQLYFPALPPNSDPPTLAEATYTFVALQAGNNTLCPYLGIDYGTTQKYDNQYCDEGNAAEIIGTIGFDFDKQVSDPTVQEGDTLTYTLRFTNTGTFAMLHTWIWDEVDPQLGQIIASTIDPDPDPGETTDNLVAWDLGNVPGESSRTFTFSIQVDAPTGDLQDGQKIVNNAFLGINEGSLPDMAATTATVTTTVMAPALTATKTDGLTTVDAGEPLTYTILITNDGSVAAVDLSATDLLPAEVALAGTPSPPHASQTGQELSWDAAALGDLAPGETLQIVIPVTVASDAPSYTSLVNDFELTYHNPADHLYQPLQASDTTTVMRSSAFVQGYVFDDTNGNGLFDAGESGIENVALSLPGALTPTLWTDADGFYEFRLESDGVYTLTETDPDNYISTTPNEVTFSIVRGMTYAVNFGDRLPDATSAAIFGTVFADTNGNGTRDGSETGIEGVTVTLDGAEVATTDGYGRYTFGIVAPGPHTVVETDLPGYISTTPNQTTVTAMADEDYQVDFGDIAVDPDLATIHGTVFADDNGDGAWNGDEAGIPGVTVTLDDGQTTTTNSHGRYWFLAIATGLHTVDETDLEGYISTTPNRVAVDAMAGVLHEVNFGDRLDDTASAAIFGTVFADDNGNAVWDTTEPGIAGVTITLDGNEVATTDGYGRYTFGTVAPGAHTVVETDLPGFTSTTPNEIAIAAIADEHYQVDFGDVLLGTGSCPSDQFEEDDGYLVANPLNPGTVYTHDFCGDPEDWHAVTVERGYIYTFTTSAFGVRADTFLSLLAPDGTTVLAANDDFAGTTDFSSQIVWTAPASGTYYLRITNRTGLTEWFTGYDVWVEHEPRYALFLPYVTVTPAGSALRPASTLPLERTRGKLLAPLSPQAPSGIIDHCNADAFEVDDTWEQAQPVLTGVPQLHTFDSNPDIYAADKDFVTFDVGPGGSLAASVNSTSTITLLELYDANGQYLNRSGTDSLVWANAPIGRYYLGVSPATPAYACDGSVSYDLTVDYTPLYRLFLPTTSR